MIEAKPFASLSSGLLARKGAAKPAMRPQAMAQFGSSMEDLGWNDMGAPAPAKAAAPVATLTPLGNRFEEPEDFEPAPPIVEQQRAAIAARFAAPAEEPATLPVRSSKAPEEEAPALARAKTAFTLRLEAERHLKLRLACAVTGRSAQQLVTEALDQLLQSRPDIAALAKQVPGNTRKPG